MQGSHALSFSKATLGVSDGTQSAVVPMRFRAGGAYTPQRSKPPLSSKSRSGWPQPLERALGPEAGG